VPASTTIGSSVSGRGGGPLTTLPSASYAPRWQGHSKRRLPACQATTQLACVQVADIARTESPVRVRYAGSPAAADTSSAPPSGIVSTAASSRGDDSEVVGTDEGVSSSAVGPSGWSSESRVPAQITDARAPPAPNPTVTSRASRRVMSGTGAPPVWQVRRWWIVPTTPRGRERFPSSASRCGHGSPVAMLTPPALSLPSVEPISTCRRR
jgi:hypothetical protein